MYAETENGLRWITERDTVSLQDPVRRAAEKLAHRAELYLYDENSDVWMKPEFLAWALAAYDKDKLGSGNYSDSQEFNPDELQVEYPHPDPDKTFGPSTHPNVAVRYPEHARLAKHVDTGETPEDDA